MSIRFSLVVLAAVALVGCGGSNSSTPTTPSNSTPPPSGAATNVSIVSGAEFKGSNSYSPNPVTVAVGGTVTWINNDSISHTSTANGGAWDTGTIPPNSQASFTFRTAGTFQYHCSFHPGMVGTVTVQ